MEISGMSCPGCSVELGKVTIEHIQEYPTAKISGKLVKHWRLFPEEENKFSCPTCQLKLGLTVSGDCIVLTEVKG